MAEPTPTPDAQDLRLWKERWAIAAPVMERLRRRELRAMSEERHRQTLIDVLDFARPETAYNRICGLAEFYQRWRRHE